MKKVAMAMLAASTAGCASLSKEECATADWQAIGYEDGAAGKPVSAVSRWRSACAKKANVTVDMAAYTDGRRQGLEIFCEPANGYALGVRGAGYAGVCAGPGEHAFSAAYAAGRQLHALQNDVAALSAQIRQAHYDLREVERDIAETEVALITPGYNVHERVELVADLKRLNDERADIEVALASLDRDYASAEESLSAYREELAYSGGWRGVAEVTDARF